MAVKNRHTAKNRRLLDVILKFILKQFEFTKTFECFFVENVAVFGDLAAILKIKQKFLFGIINNIHLSLTMQKEILERLL